MLEQEYLSVSALSKYINQKFVRDPHLKTVHVKGEVTDFRISPGLDLNTARGTVYFSLKDEDGALIRTVLFSPEHKKIDIYLKNGVNVLVRGRVSTFDKQSTYQIYIDDMIEDGLGNLHLQYEQLKAQLEKEGLFKNEHKRPIPKYPQRIGVVTSSSGAVIKDIITTIQRRYPLCQILLLPTIVQGPNAAPSIVQSIAQAQNPDFNLDLLIVGRGGGSIEDLWAFNEEPVARAIFKSKIPIISAVGHDTDHTIADFVADLRAPTPTAAAELAVPVLLEEIESVVNLENQLNKIILSKLQDGQNSLAQLNNSYIFRNPHLIYEQKLQQYELLTKDLQEKLTYKLEQASLKAEQLTKQLQYNEPSKLLVANKEQVKTMAARLSLLMKNQFEHKVKDVNHLINKLDLLNPLKIMDRGYSVVYKKDETILKSVSKVKEADRLTIQLVDGLVDCEVRGIERGAKNANRG